MDVTQEVLTDLAAEVRAIDREEITLNRFDALCQERGVRWRTREGMTVLRTAQPEFYEAIIGTLVFNHMADAAEKAFAWRAVSVDAEQRRPTAEELREVAYATVPPMLCAFDPDLIRRQFETLALAWKIRLPLSVVRA